MKQASFPQILTTRFLLRQIVPDDLQNIYKGLSDTAVIKYYGVSYDSIDDTRGQMDWYTELENSGTGMGWAIANPDGTSFYGVITLYNIQSKHRKAELGFWLLADHWGKGIISETVPFICRYAFEQLGLHRVEAFVETENDNSRKALIRLGFLHEGCMQDCEIKNGRFISLDMYALLNKT